MCIQIYRRYACVFRSTDIWTVTRVILEPLYIYACMRTCVLSHTRTHACTNTRIHICTHRHTHTRTQTQTHKHTHTYSHTHRPEILPICPHTVLEHNWLRSNHFAASITYNGVWVKERESYHKTGRGARGRAGCNTHTQRDI